MDTQSIPDSELNDFKMLIQEWLLIDKQISEREKDIKNIKKKRNKELEPKIIEFMNKNGIQNLNTESGLIKCVQRNTTEPLNKTNIRTNLSTIITDDVLLEQAMDTILSNREKKISYKLTKK